MAQVVDGRYTARMDEPFAVFIIGMRIQLHKDPAAFDRRMSGRGLPTFRAMGLLYKSIRRLRSWSSSCPVVE